MEVTTATPHQHRGANESDLVGKPMKMSPAAPRALFRLERRRDEMENFHPNQSSGSDVTSLSSTSKGTPSSKMTPNAKRHKISPKTPPTVLAGKSTIVAAKGAGSSTLSTLSLSSASSTTTRSAQKERRIKVLPLQPINAQSQNSNRKSNFTDDVNMTSNERFYPNPSADMPTTMTKDDVNMTENPSSVTMDMTTKDLAPSETSHNTKLSVSLSASKVTTSKWFPLMEYPSNIPAPSRKTITKLYNEAVEKPPSSCNGENLNDQQYVQAAGLLSCQDVLLPSLAIEEDLALRRMQKKVQRDAPQFKIVLQESRCHAYQAIEHARRNVEESRILRTRQRQERLQKEYNDEVERQCLQLQQDIKSKRISKQLQRNQKLRTMQRDFPKNKELWREVLFLLTAVTQLEKEVKLWNTLDSQLSEQEEHLSSQKSQEEKLDEEMSDKAAVAVVPMHSIHSDLESSARNMSLSSTRIQEGMRSILATMDKTDEIRHDLFTMYKNEFQFHGYFGIKNPKGMIQFLSQTQDDGDDESYYGDCDDMKTCSQGSSARKLQSKRLINGDTIELTPKSLIRRFLSQQSQED